MGVARLPVAHAFFVDFAFEDDDAGGEDGRDEGNPFVAGAGGMVVRGSGIAFEEHAIAREHVGRAERT